MQQQQKLEMSQRPLVVVLLVLGGRHLAVGVGGGVAQPVPALPRQDHPQGGPPVVTLHHRLHLEIFQIIEKIFDANNI